LNEASDKVFWHACMICIQSLRMKLRTANTKATKHVSIGVGPNMARESIEILLDSA
jgi:hypothetical protein